MNIFCIGRNYVDHAKELKNPVPSKPLIFMKPATSLLKRGEDFVYPEFSKDVHFEGELVLEIGKEGRNISLTKAIDHISRISFGIDFTARDLQSELKQKGHPWEIAKGFEGAAALGAWIEFDPEFESSLSFETWLNEQLVQEGNTADMIFNFSRIIQYISIFYNIREGDIIYTGTPAGVGPVKPGDSLQGIISGRDVLLTKII